MKLITCPKCEKNIMQPGTLNEYGVKNLTVLNVPALICLCGEIAFEEHVTDKLVKLYDREKGTGRFKWDEIV
jgi:hypothetical protein